MNDKQRFWNVHAEWNDCFTGSHNLRIEHRNFRSEMNGAATESIG